MPKTTISSAVKSGRILVSDGAWGTLLQQKGLQPGDCPELWCLERPADVLDIAQSYVDAGADMIESNSFGGNRYKLEAFRLDRGVAQLNQAAARLSRQAAGPNRWVIASVGPTGQILLTDEDVTEEEMYEAFSTQLIALEKGGADAVCIETMSALDEADLAIHAARDNTRLEVICTFAFEKNAKGQYRTMMGVSPADAAATALRAGAHIIGANCGNGIAGMVEIVRELRKAAPATPILVHANAGLPKLVKGETVFPETPEEMAAQVPALVAAGANIIGGCCGTTPAHIRAIRTAVDKLQKT